MEPSSGAGTDAGSGPRPARRRPPREFWAFGGVAVLAAAATIGVASRVGSPPRNDALAIEEARVVADRFFAAMRAHRFDRACELLSTSYLRRNRTDRATCALNLSVNFLARDLEFEIADVERAGDRVVVHAVANGSPGEVVLAREDDAYRVVSVTGG